jgi:hypothetical protein
VDILARLTCNDSPALRPRLSFPLTAIRNSGNRNKPFAAVDPFPDCLWPNADWNPKHDEVIDKIGASYDHCIAVAIDRIYHNTRGFIAELFCHLTATGTKQPRRRGSWWIVVSASQCCPIEPCDWITHRTSG